MDTYTESTAHSDNQSNTSRAPNTASKDSVDMVLAASAAASAAEAIERQMLAETDERLRLQHRLAQNADSDSRKLAEEGPEGSDSSQSATTRQIARLMNQTRMMQVRVEREKSQAAAVRAELEEAQQHIAHLKNALSRSAAGTGQETLARLHSRCEHQTRQIAGLQMEKVRLQQSLDSAQAEADSKRPEQERLRETVDVLRDSLEDARQEVLRCQQQLDSAKEDTQAALSVASSYKETLNRRSTAMDISQRVAYDRDLRTAVERAVAAAKEAWTHRSEELARQLKVQVNELQEELVLVREDGQFAQESLAVRLQAQYEEATGREREQIRAEILALRDLVESDAARTRRDHDTQLKQQLQFSLKAAACFRLGAVAARFVLKRKMKSMAQWKQVMHGYSQARRARIAMGMWYLGRKRRAESARTVLRYWHALARLRGCGVEAELLNGLVGPKRAADSPEQASKYAVVRTSLTRAEALAGTRLAPTAWPREQDQGLHDARARDHEAIVPRESAGDRTLRGYETLHTPFQRQGVRPWSRSLNPSQALVKFGTDRYGEPQMARTISSPSMGTADELIRPNTRPVSAGDDKPAAQQLQDSKNTGCILAVVLGNLTAHQSAALRPSASELLLHSARAIEDAQYAQKLARSCRNVPGDTLLHPAEELWQRSRADSLTPLGPTLSGWTDDWDIVEHHKDFRHTDKTTVSTGQARALSPQDRARLLPWGGIGSSVAEQMRREKALSSPSQGVSAPSPTTESPRRSDSSSVHEALQSTRSSAARSDVPRASTAAEVALPALLEMRTKRARLNAAMRLKGPTQVHSSAQNPDSPAGTAKPLAPLDDSTVAKLDSMIARARESSPVRIGKRLTPDARNVVEVHPPPGVVLPHCDGDTVAAPSTISLGALPRMVVRMRRRRPGPRVTPDTSSQPQQSMLFRMSEQSKVLFVEGHRLRGLARLSGIMRRVYMRKLHLGFTALQRHYMQTGIQLRLRDVPSPSRTHEEISYASRTDVDEMAALRKALAEVSAKLRQAIRDKGRAERALIAAGVD